MKTAASFFLLLLACASFAQQKETFDLATYTTPKGWKKTTDTNDVISYAITDNLKSTYCQLGIYRSTDSKGNLQADFESEWQELIVKTYKPTTLPKLVPSASENGWDAQGGAAPFEFSGSQSVVMLVTMSGSGKCMSIVILTNTEDYQQEIENFLESVDLKKLETTTQAVTDAEHASSIIGSWGKSASPNQKYDDYKRPYSLANGGYQKDQYTFNPDDTYSYFSKTYAMTFDKILLVKENGTYQVSENNLTIDPQKSVIETWSKKDGTDKWGNLLITQNRTLEKVTYQFAKHYFSGIQEWNLVLQSDKETQRDGTFSSNTTFRNAWYFKPISITNTAIELPGDNMVQPQAAVAVNLVGTTGFQFSLTNFDDGWASTVHDDWVQVAKGNATVLIHYPNKKADGYNSVVLDGLQNAWNILIAAKYSAISNLEFKPISGWQTIEFAQADAVEKTTGKMVHVVLFKMNYSNGSGKYLEFITPDKNSFEQEFGPYHQSTSGWEKMEAMATYNKFAVAASDLTGVWTNDFSGALQYVNAYTGANAGMDTHASNEKFEFGPGNTYNWSLGVASGQVGSIKFQSVKSNGQFSLPDNWKVTFSDMEGKPRTFSAYFSCVKGARILWLDENGYGRME